MAWTTPLGDDLEAVWRRLLDGASGLRTAPCEYPLRSPLAGTVPGPPGTAAARQVEFAATTIVAAGERAGVDPADPAVRLVLGTSIGGALDEPEPRLSTWAEQAARRVGQARDPVCVGTACSAGSDSLLVATHLIRAGAARVCIAGGVDVVTDAKRLGHSALGTMSADRLRAFDIRHDGMIPGEGAAMLVLESAAAARDRGATVLATLRGAGSANDAAGLTTPDRSGDSVVLAVRRCLADAGLNPADVAVISAHATGTPINDDVERASLGRLFGADAAPLVFATKGALGHSMGATGAIEAVSVVLALRDGLVPPLADVETVMPDFPLPLAVGGARAFTGTVGLSLTIGFGGFNTCLLFERTP
jgi:3-oxoacyl-[acyl-carrier-protein] synthase II